MKTLDELIAESIQYHLNEQAETRITVSLNGKVIAYGSKEHVDDLKITLKGLENLKTLFKLGTTNRHVFSQASQRLRNLVEKLERQYPTE